jgi:hypothetical protein
MENLKSSLQLLADVRNGVVHAAQLDEDSVDAVLVPFLRGCDHLLSGMEKGSREELWGDFLEMVDARLSESLQQAEVTVAEALAAARLQFEGRYGGLDADVRSAVLGGIEESYNPTKYEQALVDCPACTGRAITHGSYDVTWEPDWDYADGESYVAGMYPVVTYAPGYLRCNVCGLELDGEDELRAAAVPNAWQLEDVDPADFYDMDDGD